MSEPTRWLCGSQISNGFLCRRMGLEYVSHIDVDIVTPSEFVPIAVVSLESHVIIEGFDVGTDMTSIEIAKGIMSRSGRRMPDLPISFAIAREAPRPPGDACATQVPRRAINSI